jgi:GT2 family glycosyltransferase
VPGSVTAVIVCYDEPPGDVGAAIDSLLAQTQPPGEILIVDNGPDGALAQALGDRSPVVVAIATRSNLGYRAGISLAAARGAGDYLLVLNPDARADAACLERLTAVADADPDVAIVGAQILLEDGETCNAGDNPLHPTGISTSGRYEEPREHGRPRDIAVASGACWMIRRSAFGALGGFVDELFLYYEDTDLSWRARIAGMRVVYCPEAFVLHGYEFGRRGRKWFLLERNRLFAVLANYEGHTLLALAPLLLATEAGLLVVATLGGWLGHKLRAYASLMKMRRQLFKRRGHVQAMRRRSDAELFAYFSDRLDSPLLPGAGVALANLFCVPYMQVVRRLVR